jgi:cell division transport system permease protein
VTRAAAIALACFVPIVGGACTDDADETGRGGETLERVDAELFMEVDADKGEIHQTRARLEDSPDVHATRFLTKAGAYDEFTRLFADQPDLIEATDPADLPVSFRVQLAPGVDPATFSATFERGAGVDSVLLAPEL